MWPQFQYWIPLKCVKQFQGTFAWSQENSSWLRHVHLSVCRHVPRMRVASSGRISVKLDIGDFYEELSLIFKCGYNMARVSGSLQEDLRKFHCWCRRQSSAFKLSLRLRWQEFWGFTNITGTRYDVMKYTHCLSCYVRTDGQADRRCFNKRTASMQTSVKISRRSCT